MVRRFRWRPRVLVVRAAAHRVLARRGVRRVSWRLAVVVLALVGAALGLAVAGTTTSNVGPVKAKFSLRPSASMQGGTTVNIPPLGSMHLDTNRAPVELSATVTDINTDAARRLMSDPGQIKNLEKHLTHDVNDALIAVVARSLLAALVGAAVLTFVVTRRWKASVAAAGIALAAAAASAGTAWETWNSKAIAEPHYSGLLTRAPTMVGNVQEIVTRFGKYSTELAQLVTNMSRLYGVTSTLPIFSPSSGTVAVLHISDIHENPEAWDVVNTISKEFNVDIVVDTGDLTDHGTPVENPITDNIGLLGKPYIFIKGNHDSAATVRAVAAQPNATVLDASSITIDGLRIYGIGDPRFTPDKESDAQESLITQNGAALAERVAGAMPPKIDILLVHDPAEGTASAGEVPLILAGHLHKRDVLHLKGGTTLFVEGSTGGAGLRGLEHETPTPLEASVLYFSTTTHQLVAYDEITVGGLGLTSVSVDRHIVAKSAQADAASTPSSSPGPSQAPSTGPSPGTSPGTSPAGSP